LVSDLPRLSFLLKETQFVSLDFFLYKNYDGSFAVVDPGFRGQLTLNLHNVSEKEVTLKEGERIVQIVFHSLGSAAKMGYNGSYQNSKGIVTSRRNRQ
jgi:deoxycytidine triphosphate deaminase